MSRPLRVNEMKKYAGGAVSWFTILCVVGGVAAIYKIMFSSRGSITIGPFRANWGR